MSWGLEKSLISFDALWTTAIALLLLLLGYWLREKISFLKKYCVPAPVIGGFLMSFVSLLFYHINGSSPVEFTTSLRLPLMLMFFTTIGLGGSVKFLTIGGKALLVYLAFCWGLSILQNGLGVTLAYFFDLKPMYGIMAGAVSLEGGHAAASTFGIKAEELGFTGATTVAIAAATYGLLAGGLTGGPIASYLINKNKLKIETLNADVYKKINVEENTKTEITSKSFFEMLAIILVIMIVGELVSSKIEKMLNISLPSYVGAMFIALIVRNINDLKGWIKFNDKTIDLMADISIGIFLTMAMMTLKIWELYDLAVPLIAILIIQTIAIVAIAVLFLFPALGKNYDAAVMCAGFLGHGLGATPNAVANMGAVCERYRLFSHKAFLIVPLSGAVLIDIVAVPCITIFMNYFSK